MYTPKHLLILSFCCLIIGLVQGCAVPPPDKSCESACQELYMQCGFEAFPDKSSCTMGCMYESDQGGQVATLEECIAAADCDIFAVIECQNAFGAEQ